MRKNQFFFFPDTGAPGSSGSSAVADVIAPGGAEVRTISDYEPPGVENLDEELTRGGDLEAPGDEPKAPADVKPTPTPAPAKPAPKPAEKPVKAADPTPKPASDGRKPEEMPINELRNAYRGLKEQEAALRTELETLRSDHPEVKTLRSELEEAKKQVENLTKAGTDYERKLAFYSPAAARKISEMDAAFNQEVNPLIEDIPGLGDEYGQLVRRYSDLPRSKEKKAEFKEGLEKLEEHIIENYGERKADRVMQVIQRGARHLGDVRNAERELREDGGRFLFDQQVQEWGKAAEKFEADSKSFLEIDPEVAASDPYHPVNLLQHCKKEDPERFGELESKLRAFVRRVALGPKPKQKSDYAGMSEAQIADTLVNEARQAAQDKALSAKLLVMGGLLMAYQRPFFASYKKLEERLGAQNSVPEPRAGGTAAPARGGGDGSTVDLSNYEPPEIPSEHEFANG